MSDPTTTTSLGVAALIKGYGLKVLAGILGAAIMYAVLWPRTAREGVARMALAIAGSTLWGDVALAMVRSYAEWWPPGHAGEMPVYAAAGAPAWWVLGMIARALDNRRGKDAVQVLDELRGTARKKR